MTIPKTLFAGAAPLRHFTDDEKIWQGNNTKSGGGYNSGGYRSGGQNGNQTY